jgi:8-oxo-dGTP pyrophosphatase MutT (NUDIX family)
MPSDGARGLRIVSVIAVGPSGSAGSDVGGRRSCGGAKMTDRGAERGKALLGKAPTRKAGSLRRQYGALPYRITTFGSIEFLLVTTRQTKRWTIPKGWPAKKLKPRDSAAREAYEEAGVRGTVGTKSIGSFTYEKISDRDGASVSCEVSVYPLKVDRQFEIWPESHERQSVWFDPHGAASIVREEGLRNLIGMLVDQLASSAEN